jgi:hypothetical protein
VVALADNLKHEESTHTALVAKEQTLRTMLCLCPSLDDPHTAEEAAAALALRTHQHLDARGKGRARAPACIDPCSDAQACDDARLHLLANVTLVRRLGMLVPQMMAVLETVHRTGWPRRGSCVEQVLQRTGPHRVGWQSWQVRQAAQGRGRRHDCRAGGAWLAGRTHVCLALELSCHVAAPLG